MRSIFLVLFILSGSSLLAQSDYDARLLAKFSQERIDRLQSERPSVIEYWTYYLDHAYSIVDSGETGKNYQTDQTVEIENLDNFNILELDIHMDRRQAKTYRIQGTDKYLLLHSNQTFSELFSRYRNSSK